MKRDWRQKKMKVTITYDDDAKVEISEKKKHIWMECQFKRGTKVKWTIQANTNKIQKV